jgi:ribose transport system permease protein
MQPEAPGTPVNGSVFGDLGAGARRFKEGLMGYSGVLTVLLVLVVYFSIDQPQFRTWDNFLNILQTNSILLIVSVGLTFTLLVGGFDLSIGGVLALSGVLVAKLLQNGVPTIATLVLVIGFGIAVGIVVTGYPISGLGLNFFVVTLGIAFAARGVALVITGGSSQGLYEEELLRSIGNGAIGGIAYIVFIAIGVLLAAICVTRYTGYGRMVYAVGGNAEAARLAGINVTLVRLSAYAICAGLAAFGGFLEAGRLAAAAPDTDTGIEFTAAAAVLLGGTSFIGGVGTMLGTFLGVIFLGVLQNGLIISSISVYYQNVITGAVLVLSVLIDRFRQHRAGRA